MRAASGSSSRRARSGTLSSPRCRAIPARIATQTTTTTAHAVAVSHMPNVPSLRPAVPVASRYDVVPLQAASSSSPPGSATTRRTPLSMDIVPSLECAPRCRILVAEVALPAAIGERGGEGAALRLYVGDDLPDVRCGQGASPCRHPLRASLEDRLVDVGRRSTVAPVAVGEVGAHPALE